MTSFLLDIENSCNNSSHYVDSNLLASGSTCAEGFKVNEKGCVVCVAEVEDTEPEP